MMTCRRIPFRLLAGAALLAVAAAPGAAEHPTATDAQRRYVVGVSGMA